VRCCACISQFTHSLLLPLLLYLLLQDGLDEQLALLRLHFLVYSLFNTPFTTPFTAAGRPRRAACAAAPAFLSLLTLYYSLYYSIYCCRTASTSSLRCCACISQFTHSLLLPLLLQDGLDEQLALLRAHFSVYSLFTTLFTTPFTAAGRP
jgi:hypothetical protein